MGQVGSGLTGFRPPPPSAGSSAPETSPTQSLYGVAHPVDPYARGGLWASGNASINGGGWYANGNNSSTNFDLAFQTWVDDGTAIPAPGVLALLALGPMSLRRRAR